MKKYDLVYLKNNSQYRKYGIEKNTHGIIIDIFQNHCQVLFFNPHNLGGNVIRAQRVAKQLFHALGAVMAV